MFRDIFYILLGYICGSILFARVFGSLICKKDIINDARDQNPGTANAFINGGFLCGVLTLFGDLMKGIVPVYLYFQGRTSFLSALVIAAPVIGHIFPIFFRFHGGKGIATTFGSLLGLFPDFMPAVILAVIFVFFSVVLNVSPHYHRTLLTYFAAEAGIFLFTNDTSLHLGFTIIFVAVTVRMLKSKEEKEQLKVKILWMH